MMGHDGSTLWFTPVIWVGSLHDFGYREIFKTRSEAWRSVPVSPSRIASGKRLHNYGTSPRLMGTIYILYIYITIRLYVYIYMSMATFQFAMLNCQLNIVHTFTYCLGGVAGSTIFPWGFPIFCKNPSLPWHVAGTFCQKAQASATA